MKVYYNEFDKNAAQWLRNLIAAGELPEGEVDERSIVEVKASDLTGFSQLHFFAGIGGWPLALRLADWPADREVWTGSCPCQPFSAAGKRLGFADSRHLWPAWFRLIRERRPSTIFGEQVAHAKVWFDQVCADLESVGYAVGAAILPAAGVGFHHFRYRIFFMAHADGARLEGLHAPRGGIHLQSAYENLSRYDRKATPRVFKRVNGFSRKLDKPSTYKEQVIGFGGAIVPQVACEFIASALAALKKGE